MFHLEQYAGVARAYLASKGITQIQNWPISDMKDDVVVTQLSWLIHREGLENEYEAFEERRLGNKQSRQFLHIDVEKTRRYYAGENTDAYCQCPGCVKYRKRIAAERPEIGEYLATLGIDIAKPFHLSYLEPENGVQVYTDCHYVAFGDGDLAWSKDFGDAELLPGLFFPDPGVEEPFVVLEIPQIYLPFPQANGQHGEKT